MTTPLPKVSEIERRWYVVDASDKVLGRLATQIATRLRGKHKPIFTPHLDTGDFIIVVNADKIRLTGQKLDKKLYYSHSGYLGSMKAVTARKLLETKPEKVILWPATNGAVSIQWRRIVAILGLRAYFPTSS